MVIIIRIEKIVAEIKKEASQKLFASKNLKKRAAKMKPVRISTRRYCGDIFDLQTLQRPARIIKLKIGTSSRQRNFFLQEKQTDLPEAIGMSVPYRSATTFRKLPTKVPKIKTKRSPK